MTDQDLSSFCLEYGVWCRTRRLLAPPVPVGILARLQPRKFASEIPDAPMSAEMAYFNMAVHALSDELPECGICFTLYHVHGFRPVKVLAAAMGVSTRTFYDRVQRFSRKALRLALVIERAHSGPTMSIT
ncbi:hypothetical protein PAQ31011_00804 [Pandoraea aquatica]|uniref:Uncharacterized protein n=1 Tax=Pandoraea aquatica TaxID=2508290 RepID=A0A5E4SJQ0_9BURK|nr:sigma-70 family RNA polymerase sigma factor [Pandoraea aquatica]VVD74684.1 hypothetical protein PAQ31011_00804 [Pandoraea aquatica]